MLCEFLQKVYNYFSKSVNLLLYHFDRINRLANFEP